MWGGIYHVIDSPTWFIDIEIYKYKPMSTDIHLPQQIFHSTIGDINLSELTSPWLILYFYPKDNTAGCSLQAHDFSQLLPQFQQLGATIIGVSRDSIKSHHNFTEKQCITFPLISDADETLCQHFDVIKQKNMYGKQVLGVERSTFIFKNGQLLRSYRKVKSKGHAEQVLQDLTHLNG